MASLPRSLELQFKGSRTYLQGGDIYNSINNIAPELTGQSNAYLSQIVFRRFARRECEVWIEQSFDNDLLVATGLITYGKEESQRIWVVETNRPVNSRYEFNEKDIIDPAFMEGNQITLNKKTAYTPIEEVIALTKALDYALIPNVQGKWLFAQLELRQPFLKEQKSVRIVQKATLGRKFAIHDIFQDNVLIGEIRYITGEP
jgi:hypothetical protein